MLCQSSVIKARNLQQGGGANPIPTNLSANHYYLLKDFSRNYDGTGHNENNFQWGSSFQQLNRITNDIYASDPLSKLPQPRTISNTIGGQTNPVPDNSKNLSVLFTIFGQFIDHDLSITSSQSPIQNANIPIPQNDPFFTNAGQLQFKRSNYTLDSNNIRQQISSISAWIDGGNIYGSDQARANSLRSFSQGKMRISTGRLLPKDSNNVFFVAGDVRANQNAILTSIHTLFVRYHNYMCDQINSKLTNPTDQQTYTIARNYVTAVFQKIVFKDWLSLLLGQATLPPFEQYDNGINPTLDNEFTTAAFRFGHSLLKDKIFKNGGATQQSYNLWNLFGNPSLVDSTFVKDILQGAGRTKTKERDLTVVDDIRNLLVFAQGSQVKTDLFSLNIQRGRDHGLPTYGQMLSNFGLPSVHPDFAGFTPFDQNNVRLNDLYDTADNMDLWIGILGQKTGQNSISLMGPVGNRIIRRNFRRIRDGDKYYYENRSIYPQQDQNAINQLLNEINKTTLIDIIRKTQSGNIPIQVKNLFIVQ